MSFPTARSSRKPTSEPPPARTAATLVPSVARAVVGLIEDRGLSPERLCRGLGFTDRDLLDSSTLVSFEQTRSLILRAQRLLGDPACGLAVGARQTPASWGVVGLAMLTCETLGEAIAYALTHQDNAGAMVDHLFEMDGEDIVFEMVPRIRDREIEPFLVDSAFAAAVNVSRYLAGKVLHPTRLELAFPLVGSDEPYRRFYGCPVRFDAPRNRLWVKTHWAEVRLPGYDRFTSSLLREQLTTLIRPAPGRHELVESVSSRIRSNIESRPRQEDMARQVNVSERTLRRRLGAQAAGYRQLRDAAAFERARELLAGSTMTIEQVAQSVGYSDARAFRRAFKRWSGQLPTAFRQPQPTSRD